MSPWLYVGAGVVGLGAVVLIAGAAKSKQSQGTDKNKQAKQSESVPWSELPLKKRAFIEDAAEKILFGGMLE
jgi:hypothetical protein